jgi:hypothetical protein
MSEYRLEVLVLLRRVAMDVALRKFRTSADAAREATREHQRLEAEVESWRARASAPYSSGQYQLTRHPARTREIWRGMVQAARRSLDIQRESWQQALAVERQAAQALAGARAAREALDAHRRRWLEARRVKRAQAEEREVEDWLNGRQTCGR